MPRYEQERIAAAKSVILEAIGRAGAHNLIEGGSPGEIAQALGEILSEAGLRVQEVLPQWTPMERAMLPKMTEGELQRRARRLSHDLNMPVEVCLEELRDILRIDEVWMNSRYQVNVRRQQSNVEGAPELVHLSIKRRDKQPLGPERYRDLMRIKDELVGPEIEGAELYPARSREVDSATQYHVWCINDTTFRFPFGMDAGEPFRVEYTPNSDGANQNRFEAHHVGPRNTSAS